jgi:glycerate kinase
MRVLVAPDSFTGSMSAAEAARAIADGWRATAPQDDVVLVPVSDGGPGFVAALHAALGGEPRSVPASGPWGAPAAGSVLVVPGSGGPVAYLEAAHAAGDTGAPRGAAAAASSAGLAELLRAAVESGARRIVVGVGGTLICDGGAGMLAGLGATAVDAAGGDCTALLRAGVAGLSEVAAVDLAPARAITAGVELIVATDVDNPLLGPRGAARGFGPQKGLDPAAVDAAEEALRAFAHACGRFPGGRSPAVALGSGAGGGLGFALLHLGGRVVAGIDVVLDAVGFEQQVGGADLVITGEGSLDWQSMHGKVITGVCRAAMAHGRPVLVLAGRIAVGRREWMAIGVSGAYAIIDAEAPPAQVRAAVAEGPRRLAGVASRAARTWSR